MVKLYEGYKLRGPYLRPDGRKHLVIVKPNGKKTTLSYPKYLMEMSLGRYLEDNETVDHIDRDFSNDSPENLRVIDRTLHASDDAKRTVPLQVTCIWCGNKFTMSTNQQCHRKFHGGKGKSGPFCGNSCTGEYGAYIQNGGGKLESVEYNYSGEHFYKEKF